MDRKTVLEAAATIQLLDAAKALRATIHGGKHQLRLYAVAANQTMDDQVEVDQVIAKSLLNNIVVSLESRLKELGVAR